PDRWDLAKRSVLEEYLSQHEGWQEYFESRLDDNLCGGFGGFVRRASAVAVRTHDPRLVKLSVVALAIAHLAPRDYHDGAGYSDYRDVAIYEELPWRTALKLGGEPRDIYDAVIPNGSPAARRWIVEFRAGIDRRASFVFEEGANDDGFLWKRKGVDEEKIQREIEELERRWVNRPF